MTVEVLCAIADGSRVVASDVLVTIDDAIDRSHWFGYFATPPGMSFFTGQGPFFLTTAKGWRGYILISHVSKTGVVRFEGTGPLERGSED